MPVHHGTDVLFMASQNTTPGTPGSISTAGSVANFNAATGINNATIASIFSTLLSSVGAGPAAGETLTGGDLTSFTTITFGGKAITYYAGQSSAGRSAVYVVGDNSWHVSPKTSGPIFTGP